MTRLTVRMYRGVLFALLLSGCSTTLQTTSGMQWLGAIPPSTQVSSDIDQRVREVANVEPILRFPARIGLARIGQENSRPALIPTPAEEAKAWVDLAEDLGPEYGEFVPISPLIAAMVSPPHPANVRTDMIKDTLEMIRLAAARQHLNAVLIYEVDGTADSKNNPLSLADWTLIGAFVLPSQDVKAQGLAQAILIDVRNGYHYGTVQAVADDKTVAARFANHEAELNLTKRVEAHAVRNLTRETRGLVRQLKVRLAALDRPTK
jgi:hypothetical protein